MSKKAKEITEEKDCMECFREALVEICEIANECEIDNHYYIREGIVELMIQLCVGLDDMQIIGALEIAKQRYLEIAKEVGEEIDE